jgi:hypothetical protein
MANDLCVNVNSREDFQCLLHDEDFFLVCASKGAIASNFLLRSVIGFPVSKLLRGDAGRVFRKNKSMIARSLLEGASSCIWWAPAPINTTKVGLIDFGMELHLNFLGGRLIHIRGREIKESESLTRPHGDMLFDFPTHA